MSAARSVSFWLSIAHSHLAIEPSGPGIPTFICWVSARSDPRRNASTPILSSAMRWRITGSSPRPRSLMTAISSSRSRRTEIAEAGALVHQGGDGDHPAVAFAAHEVLVVHMGALEEDLVELGLARDLAEGAHLHPVLLHVAD